MMHWLLCLTHSSKPNMRTRDGYDFVAMRKILVGEELTVDYRTYGAEDLVSCTMIRNDYVRRLPLLAIP